MMVNKRGVLRIVEATIAVLIILVSIVFLASKREIPENRDVGLVVPSLMDEIAKNLTFREDLAKGNNEEILEKEIELSLKKRLDSPIVNVSVKICNLTEVCFLEPYPDTDEDIFSSERVISGSVKNETIKPKKVKIFMWKNTF
jgi:hypothetical protein